MPEFTVAVAGLDDRPCTTWSEAIALASDLWHTTGQPVKITPDHDEWVAWIGTTEAP